MHIRYKDKGTKDIYGMFENVYEFIMSKYMRVCVSVCVCVRFSPMYVSVWSVQ